MRVFGESFYLRLLTRKLVIRNRPCIQVVWIAKRLCDPSRRMSAQGNPNLLSAIRASAVQIFGLILPSPHCTTGPLYVRHLQLPNLSPVRTRSHLPWLTLIVCHTILLSPVLLFHEYHLRVGCVRLVFITFCFQLAAVSLRVSRYFPLSQNCCHLHTALAAIRNAAAPAPNRGSAPNSARTGRPILFPVNYSPNHVIQRHPTDAAVACPAGLGKGNPPPDSAGHGWRYSGILYIICGR